MDLGGMDLGGFGAGALLDLLSGGGPRWSGQSGGGAPAPVPPALDGSIAAQSVDWADAVPTIFAAASGAVAVAALLLAALLLRRLRRVERARRGLAAKLSADRSQERVFIATRRGLAPASPATEAELKRLERADAAPFSARFDAHAKPDRGAVAAPDQAAVGGPLFRRVFGEDAARAIAHRILDLVRDGAPFEHRGRDAQGRAARFVGETRGADALVRILPDDGGPDATIGSAEPRRAAAPQVVALAAALDGAPSGVVMFNAQNRMMSANAAARRLLGLRPDWVSTGPTLRGLLDRLRHAGRAPERSDSTAWRAALLADPVKGFNAEPLWAPPTQEALRFSAAPLAGGGFVLFVADESDALALERRYRRAIEASQATVSAIDQGLLVIGPHGAVRMANAAFVALWDLDPADVDPTRGGGSDVSDLARIAARDAADRQLWLDLRAALAGDGPRRSQELAGRRGDGARLSMRLSPLPDGSTLVAMRDMTDADAASAALRERGDALESVDRLKTAFVNDLAHELRSPLNTVTGFAEFLKQGAAGPLNERQAEYVACVLKGAGALRDLISDALDLGALESGAMALERSPTPVGTLVDAAAAAMATRAEARRAAMAAPRPGSAAQLVVRADAERLRAAVGAVASVVAGQASAGDALSIDAARIGDDRLRLTFQLARVAPLDGAPGRAEAVGVAASLAIRMIEAHGGAASFAADADGARALIELPLSIAPRPTDGPRRAATEPPSAEPTPAAPPKSYDATLSDLAAALSATRPAARAGDARRGDPAP